MAFLEETEVFEPGIYQWETTDPLVGGPNGIDNVPTKQLANRTKWLKAAVDSIMGAAFEAAKAVKLKTPRKINGVDFDGTADINIAVDIGSNINSSAAKTTLVDADEFGIWDSSASAFKKVDTAIMKTVFQSPAGAIIYYAKSTPPTGYLKANGAAVSRTAYAALFAAIGTTFGVGDGATTFNIPDLRGEFIRSWDDGRGIDVNRVFGSWQVDDFKSHTHSLPYGPNAGGGSYALNNVYNAIPLSGYTGATQTSGGVETRPRNIALLACIKY